MNPRVSSYGAPRAHRRLTDAERKREVKRWNSLRSAGYTVEEAALMVGTHFTTLYRWERDLCPADIWVELDDGPGSVISTNVTAEQAAKIRRILFG